MAQLSPRECLHRSTAAWAVKDLWKGLYEEAYDLAFAGVSPYTADQKNPRPMSKQFDSTAPNAVVKLANRLLMDMTPPDQNWVELKPGPVLAMQAEKSQLDQLDEILSSASQILNLTINDGSMIFARHAAFIDLIVTGMGVLLTLEDPEDPVNPSLSVCVSQAEVAVEKDAKGRTVGVYRRRKVKVREIQSLWHDAEIPAEILDMIQKAKKSGVDPEVEILEATYYGGPKSNVPWYYEVFWAKSGTKDPARMVSRVYQSNPWTILQWLVLPGCPYGPGPVLLALPDIRTANKIVEMILTNAALALAGMYLVRDDGVLNPDNITITQFGMIPVGSTGGNMGASMVPLETGRNFDIGHLMLGDYQQAIKKFLYDNSLPDLDATPRSATEIINRVRELTQDIGGGIGRLSSDMIQYVRRVLDVLVSQGIIPVNIKIDQFAVKAQITAPLVRAQMLQEVEAVVQWLQMIISLVGPEQASVVAKMDQIAEWIADRMGVPNELVRDEDERKAEIERRTNDAMQMAAVDAQMQQSA